MKAQIANVLSVGVISVGYWWETLALVLGNKGDGFIEMPFRTMMPTNAAAFTSIRAFFADGMAMIPLNIDCLHCRCYLDNFFFSWTSKTVLPASWRLIRVTTRCFTAIHCILTSTNRPLVYLVFIDSSFPVDQCNMNQPTVDQGLYLNKVTRLTSWYDYWTVTLCS